MARDNSPGSEHSSNASSNASSYSSIDITEAHVQEQVAKRDRSGHRIKKNGHTVYETRTTTEMRYRPSPPNSVPDNAPPLPQGAIGVYDRQNRDFYAVTPSHTPGVKGLITRWSESAQRFRESLPKGTRKVADFIVDVAPTLAQGIANQFGEDSTGARITNYAAAGLQVVAAARDGKHVIDQYRAGGHQNWGDVAATGLRGVAALGNAVHAAAQGTSNSAFEQAGDISNSVATHSNGIATGIDMFAPSQSDLEAQRNPYQLPANPTLGSAPGQYPPGYDVSNLSNASGTDSFGMGGLQRALPLSAYPQPSASTDQGYGAYPQSTAFSRIGPVNMSPSYTAQSSQGGGYGGYPSNAATSSAAQSYTQQQGTWGNTAPSSSTVNSYNSRVDPPSKGKQRKK
ncbi:hypothetical protein ACIQJX_18460 [Streptomyces griseoviridis]|uniref:hypothetical protein n=1 Tax=Streptomyces griseoviridis TaxID=45398 RepID=UPI0034306A80